MLGHIKHLQVSTKVSTEQTSQESNKGRRQRHLGILEYHDQIGLIQLPSRAQLGRVFVLVEVESPSRPTTVMTLLVANTSHMALLEMDMESEMVLPHLGSLDS